MLQRTGYQQVRKRRENIIKGDSKKREMCKKTEERGKKIEKWSGEG
jgi:hypothetical protein